MSFVLVYGDHEMTLPLQFEAHVEEKLIRLMRASPDSPLQERRRLELSSSIVEVISSMLENNVIPPSEKQVKYAVAIARELNLQIPATVLQHRDAMTEFLANHAETYRKSRVR
ncbi:hypothetical protein [Sinimarinibacterium thermocellulolyticum]|uniref:Uncharacterized protein n=1 Tax=Sinimarinibacterium thermocellulolyticum TaxID=3170016 RepID=A0ABV2AB59_9GAMM